MSSLLRAASLFGVIAVAAVLTLPKIDLPETAFNETDAPSIQTILSTTATSFQQCSPSRAGSGPMAFPRMSKARAPAYTAQSSGLPQFRTIRILRC